MDSYHNKIISEINAELDQLAEQERPWAAQWVTEAICKAHKKGLTRDNNDDRWFWEYNARAYVRKLVTRVINERAGDKTDRNQPRQISLPGFNREHLQDYYTVVRDGREEGIAVTQLTADELLGKAAFLRSMGHNCIKHAREIQRYIEWRNNGAGKAAVA